MTPCVCNYKYAPPACACQWFVSVFVRVLFPRGIQFLISLLRVRCSAWGKFFWALEGFVGAEHFEQATLIIFAALVIGGRYT